MWLIEDNYPPKAPTKKNRNYSQNYVMLSWNWNAAPGMEAVISINLRALECIVKDIHFFYFSSSALFSYISSTFTKLFPLLSGMVFSAHRQLTRPVAPYKKNKPWKLKYSFIWGKKMMLRAPLPQSVAWTKPIDWVLISVGKTSLNNEWRTGIMPIALMIEGMIEITSGSHEMSFK